MHSKFTDILTGTRRVPPLEPPESATTRTGGTPVPPLKEEQILEAVASGDQPVADIAQRAGISILELARIVTTPRNLEALERVKLLHAIEREMLLGKLKRDALVRLAELTDEVPAGSADEVRAFEVMRRACRDLIRYGTPGSATDNPRTKTPSPPPFHPGGPGGNVRRGYPGGGYHPEPLTPAFEAEVLEALEKLGEEKNEYEPQARVSGSVCGCHGQAPPARVCENPVDSRANSLKQRACPWHPSPEVRPPPPPDTPPPPEVTSNVIPTRSRYNVPVSPPETPRESHLSLDPGSHNGPGADASGSLGKCTGKMPVPLEDAPPESTPLQPLRAHHRPVAGSERKHGGCRAPPHSAKM